MLIRDDYHLFACPACRGFQHKLFGELVPINAVDTVVYTQGRNAVFFAKAGPDIFLASILIRALCDQRIFIVQGQPNQLFTVSCGLVQIRHISQLRVSLALTVMLLYLRCQYRFQSVGLPLGNTAKSSIAGTIFFFGFSVNRNEA